MTVRFKMPISYAIGAFSSGVGNILPGTQLRFYDSETTTPRAVYSDAELSTAITQPIAADSVGRFPDIYLQSGLYKVRWETSAGAEIDTWDKVDPGLATGGSGGILAVADGGTGASTAGGARTNLGAAPQTGLDAEITARQETDARVTVLESAASFIEPGHRLTLTTAVPVLVSDVTAATTVYLSPWKHNRIPLWDGSSWSLVEFDEVSQTIADTTKSPAGGATNSCYDMFAWLDSTTPRCTRGPAWDSVTSRGTGAGKTELEQIDGVWVNKQNITNGPLARAGRYMGTILTDGSTQLSMMFLPSAAAGGSANKLSVWNMYNRVDVTSVCRDSTDTWTYTTATIRAANAAAGSGIANRITLVRGLNEEAVTAEYTAVASNSGAGVTLIAGIGLDATNAIVAGSIPGSIQSNSTSTAGVSFMARYAGHPGLGSHFIQELEYSAATGTTTWYGDNGAPTLTQAGMTLRTRM